MHIGVTTLSAMNVSTILLIRMFMFYKKIKNISIYLSLIEICREEICL